MLKSFSYLLLGLCMIHGSLAAFYPPSNQLKSSSPAIIADLGDDYGHEGQNMENDILNNPDAID